MMSGDDRCFVYGQTGPFGHHCPDAQCYGYDEFGQFAQDCPHKIPSPGIPCHHGRSHSRHQYTNNISAGYSPTPILTNKEAAVLEGTSHALLPATAAACTALQLMDAPVTP